VSRPADPLPFVRSRVELETIDSTSNLARELAADPAIALPLLVRAQRQTAGRGRWDRRWFSDSGSLTFTVALEPEAHGLRVEHQPRVAVTAAVAIVEAVAPLLRPGAVGIRWPNDVEVGDRKLAGILPERIETPGGPRLLVGIGLNVATRFDDAPPDVRRLATSLEREGSTTLEPGEVLRRILERLGPNLDALARDDPDLAVRWSTLDTLLGRSVAVEQGGTVRRGVGAGITPEGALTLATEEGTRLVLGGTVLRPVEEDRASRDI
jgi:BirA family biotin operon repressor/biotin-[acetyl-CoA-carboxylase] ligase